MLAAGQNKSMLFAEAGGRRKKDSGRGVANGSPPPHARFDISTGIVICPLELLTILFLAVD
jgi:hypothetical protein